MNQVPQLILLFFLCLATSLNAQDSLHIPLKTIGLEYYGELALHPGIKGDIGLSLWTNASLHGKKNRLFYQQIILRPSIGYYYIPKYTHNYFVGSDFCFQFSVFNTRKKKRFLFESFFGLRYLRYSYIGTIYESNENGSFTEKASGGGNAVMVPTGFLFGGSLPFTKFEWILGAEYFIEFSEDKLIVHHPVARLGLRFKL